MKLRPFACVLLVGTSCVVTSPLAGDGPSPVLVQLADPGFENGMQTHRPVGWTPESVVPLGAAWKVDDSQHHAGRASLLIEASAPSSVSLLSDTVTLRVGRVYRLTGWARTENAIAEPESRYPTAVPACLSMRSFPFTNHSPAAGGTSEWSRIDLQFVATASRDSVRVQLGCNGTATGKVWFDELELGEVQDIVEFVPWETVRWAGEGYRYDDQGWIFVHAEGKPFERGYQQGYLLAQEIAAYITKVAIQENAKDPATAWNNLRTIADADFLRKFDPEFLEEMKGIADGAARGGAKYDNRAVDLADIVALNSWIDIGQIKNASKVTPHALTGRNFLSTEEELQIPDEKHKCSAFVAQGKATPDGRIVMGQLFMWGGYTGVHFNVLLDVAPAKGRRLIFQTFPGGIHSGTDFYMNDAGIVIGETTVAQTPYEQAGTPQSNRIRKAAQYATSIDAVARILREGNNGLYTNDWVIADVKRNESAIFLLGTKKERLWRNGDNNEPFGTPGFLWSVNNNRDPDVRREYAAQPEDAPFDVVFSPWNRDVAMKRFYEQNAGRIDGPAAARMLASSPINRPHACDGKLTTSEMAERLVLLAHQGKVTLREKFPVKDSRRMPDLPGAIPHLVHDYAAASPIFITQQLKQARARHPAATPARKDPTLDLDAVKERYKLDKKRLWHGTVLPASDADNWFVSGTASYWTLLHGLPDEPDKAFKNVGDQLADLQARFLYVTSREQDFAPASTVVQQDRYAPYQVPRIKGLFALHQLRLLLGNDAFLRVMNELHGAWAGRRLKTDALLKTASKAAGRDVSALLKPWIEQAGLPDPQPSIRVEKEGDAWKVRVEVKQPAGRAWHLLTSVAIDAGDKRTVKPMEVQGALSQLEATVPAKPDRVVFNPSTDFPVQTDRAAVWANLSDDFEKVLIVYGTSRQIEANHTLALRWQATVADAYTENLLPVVRDCEVSDAQLRENDLVVLGGPDDNAIVARLAGKIPVPAGRGWFRWDGQLYGSSDDGLFAALPNPWNPARKLYLFLSNSALQLHQMTRSYVPSLPGWALFKGDEIKQQGHHPVARFVL
jgi:hypothetical protein